MSNKKVQSDLDVSNGKVITQGIERPVNGSPTQVFTTDGGLTELPSINGSANDGLKYFKAAYKSGLTFLVTAEWQLGGTLYLMRQTELTLSAADGTFDRIDVIAVDDTGSIIIITGTPAATPLKPTVDPVTELEGTFITVPAGSAVPEGTIVTNVYFENLGTGGGEWGAAQLGGTINVASTSAISGSVSIEGTSSVAGNQVIFTPSAPIDLELNPMKQLNYILQNKAVVNGKGDTHRFVFNGLDGASNPVSVLLAADLAYDQGSVTTQFLSLTVPSFTEIKTLENIQFQINAKSAFGFFLDDVRLVETPATATVGNWATIDYVVQRDNYIISLIEASAFTLPVDFTVIPDYILGSETNVLKRVAISNYNLFLQDILNKVTISGVNNQSILNIGFGSNILTPELMLAGNSYAGKITGFMQTPNSTDYSLVFTLGGATYTKAMPQVPAITPIPIVVNYVIDFLDGIDTARRFFISGEIFIDGLMYIFDTIGGDDIKTIDASINQTFDIAYVGTDASQEIIINRVNLNTNR